LAMTGKALNVVEVAERREIVRSAGIIVSAFAGADEDAAVPAGCGLAYLHIKGPGVQGDFAGHSDSALIRAKVISLPGQAQRYGECLQALAGFAVKEMLLRFVIGARFVPVDFGHGLSPDAKKPAKGRGLLD
jgi:hypothetical protein